MVIVGVVLACLVVFIYAHLVLIAWCAAGVGVVAVAFVIWCRHVSNPSRLAEVRAIQSQPAGSPRAVAGATAEQAIPAPQPRAIGPAQHLHLHFHGMSTEDAAAIMRRQDDPARPAIKEDPWSPSSSSRS